MNLNWCIQIVKSWQRLSSLTFKKKKCIETQKNIVEKSFLYFVSFPILKIVGMEIKQQSEHKYRCFSLGTYIIFVVIYILKLKSTVSMQQHIVMELKHNICLSYKKLQL